MTDKHTLSRLCYEIVLEAIGRDQVNTDTGSATDRALTFAYSTEDPDESVRLLLGGLGSFVSNVMTASIGEDEARSRVRRYLDTEFGPTPNTPDTTLRARQDEAPVIADPHEHACTALIWSTILHTLGGDAKAAIYDTLAFTEGSPSPEDELLDLFISTAGLLGRTLQHYLGPEGARDYVHVALFQNDLDTPFDGTPEQPEATP